LVTGPYLYTPPLGSDVHPQWMDMYYGTVWSAVVHTNYAPLRENPHLEPRFPDGGGLGGFVFVAVVAGVGRRGHPFMGGWSHSPPWGRVVTFLVVCFVLLCFESCEPDYSQGDSLGGY